MEKVKDEDKTITTECVPCQECEGSGDDDFGQCIHCDGKGYTVETRKG